MWGEILGALVGAGGSVGSSALGASAAASQNTKARRLAYDMAQRKYQFAVEDLKKAGLNPVLAAGVNPNPGTGTGYVDQSASYRGVGGEVASSVSKGVSSALGMRTARAKAQQEEELAREARGRATTAWLAQDTEQARTKALHHQAYKDWTQAQNNEVLGTKIMADTQAVKDLAGMHRASAAEKAVHTKLLQYSLPSAKTQAEFDQTKTGQTLREVRRILDSGAPAAAGRVIRKAR